MKTTNQRELIADKDSIAYCGLYCGACPSYLKGKCPGCKDNIKASWCKVRQCCIENNLKSCADCKTVELMECRKFNNFMSGVVGYLLNSDRKKCIDRIREEGYDNFAIAMADYKRVSIKRR